MEAVEAKCVCLVCVRREVGWGLSLRVSESQSVSPTHDARQPGFHPNFPTSSLHTHTSPSFSFSLLGCVYERLTFSLRQKRSTLTPSDSQGFFFLTFLAKFGGLPTKVFVWTHLHWRPAGMSRSRPSPERRPARDAAF